MKTIPHGRVVFSRTYVGQGDPMPTDEFPRDAAVGDVVVAEDRPRAAVGTGVDAVIRTVRRP
jgi:hypothetical protein